VKERKKSKVDDWVTEKKYGQNENRAVRGEGENMKDKVRKRNW